MCFTIPINIMSSFMRVSHYKLDFSQCGNTKKLESPALTDLIMAVLYSIVVRLLLLPLAATIVYEQAGNEATVITPDCGKILGVISDHTVSGGHTYHFYNIPYAQPPIGEKRFQYPTVLTGGDCYGGTLDARVERPAACVQPDAFYLNMSLSENCLVLTVISPNLAPDAPLPVVFWIHGGGLVGGANNYPGYSFSGTEVEILSAVVVNVNYRLGFLGFLQLQELWETDESYGNYGIQDQIAALKWVQNNIAAFGGNPDSVTIIGESAGATSVLALVSSPLANNLFQRGIAFSPAPEISASYKDGARIHKNLMEVSDLTGCDKDETDILSCLRKVSPEKLIPPIDLTKIGYFDFPMRYGVDYDNLNMIFTDPITVINQPKQIKDAEYKPNKKIKLILSNTEYENSFLRINGVLPSFTSTEEVYPVITTLLKNLNFSDEEAVAAVEDMKKIYDYVDNPQYLYDLITSDMRQTCAINNLATEMSQSDDHDIYRILISTGMESAPYVRAYHSWDTDALFDFIIRKFLSGYEPGPRDLELRDNLRNLIKRFIRDEDFVDNWGAYPRNSLVFGNDKPMLKLSDDPPRKKECVFLRKYGLDKYGAHN